MRLLNQGLFVAGTLTLIACGGDVESVPSIGNTSPGGAGGGGGAGTATIPKDIPDSATLTMAAFSLTPGEEAYYCQNFANPFGTPVDVDRIESHMTPGSHHLLLNGGAGSQASALTKCDGLTPPSGPYASQVPDDQLTYPAGVAARVDDGFMLQAHYLNTTGASLSPTVTVTLHRTTATITAHAQMFSGIDLDINVPANSMGSASSSTTLPSSVHLLRVSGHMHRNGTRFTASIGSNVLYDVDSWEAPAKVFDPAMALPDNTTIQFACEYQNNSSQPLTFGESAQTNEMCILIGQYY